MTGLVEMAGRCEEASGVNPRLDEVIWMAMHPQAVQPIQTPRYTESLDAAMSLVPDGWLLHFLQEIEYLDPSERMVWTVELHLRGVGDAQQAWAQSPALALCAAALRARATPSESSPT